MTPTTLDPKSEAPSAPESPLGLAGAFQPPTLEQWRKVAEGDLAGAEFEKKLVWRTLEGIPVQPLYVRGDLEGVTDLAAYPAVPPYVRGTRVGGAWQVRQDCLLPTPEEVNAALRDGLARGETSICIRLDDAARRGYDGDSPAARNLAGHGGCTLSTIGGLRVALADIDLGRYPIFFRTGAAALPVLAMLLALAEERGIDWRELRGGVECDPIRSLARNGGTYPSLDLLYREMTDMVAFCGKHCRGIRPVTVNSHPFHNAGASAVEELAATIASGAEYLRALTARGIAIDRAAQAIGFSFSVSTNVFMEIAKLRAARGLWAKVVHAFGATEADSLRMAMHTRTSTRNKTRHDPYNNMLRTQIEAFAAACAGTDSMFVAPFDELHGRPSELGARAARNQQHLLREEAHVGRVADPAAGSYYVESLTDALGREAWKLFQEIEGVGGMVAALRAGTVQRRIADSAGKRRAMVESRRESIVGVNQYANPTEKALPAPSVESRQAFLEERRRKLTRVKSMRWQSKVAETLNALSKVAETGTGNLLEAAVAAAHESATIGEIVAALVAGDSGKLFEVEPLAAARISEPFEQLRARAERHAGITGRLPGVVLLTTGPLGMRRARADFSTGFYGAGGFVTREVGPFATAEEAAKGALGAEDRIVAVCSDDATYPTFVPDFIKLLRAARPDAIVHVAGYPPEHVEALRAAGVDDFVHMKADLLRTLAALMDRMGVGN